MNNSHFPEEECKNLVYGISPASSRRIPEFSRQLNKPIKPTFTKTCSPEESQSTNVRRNPASSGKPNTEESVNTGSYQTIPTSSRKTDNGDDRETMLSGRERLKRHREEVAGKVSVPENWGKEGLLKNWMDFSAFDSAFSSNQIFSAQAALMADDDAATRRGVSRQRLRIESSC